jgi:hypothetical protein
MVIGIVLFVILDMCILIFVFSKQGKKKKQKSALQQKEAYELSLGRSLLATAKVSSIVNSTDLPSGSTKANIRFEVTPSAGEPFNAASSWLVESASLSLIQPGSVIQVKADPQLKKVYPAVPWAQYWYYDD